MLKFAQPTKTSEVLFELFLRLIFVQIANLCLVSSVESLDVRINCYNLFLGEAELSQLKINFVNVFNPGNVWLELKLVKTSCLANSWFK